VWPEGLSTLKKYNDIIGNRTRELPACSIVPQSTTLPRAPGVEVNIKKLMPVQVPQYNETQNDNTV
jgi:hypothetical protein